MNATEIKRIIRPGDVFDVTNHYIERTDHPCYGTRIRTIVKTSSSGIHFDESGYVPWPKAAQLRGDGTYFYFYGGGCGQTADDLFLTLRRIGFNQPEETDQ